MLPPIRGQDPALPLARGPVPLLKEPVPLLSFILNCPPVHAARRLIRLARQVAQRPAARRVGLGTAAPRAARRAASLAPAVKLGGLVCLLGPALLPSPAMGPMDTPATLQRAAPAEQGLPGLGLLGLGLAGGALPEDVLAGIAPGSPGGALGDGTTLMAAAAGLTELEHSVLPGTEAPPAAPTRLVVVPEPASLGLFAVGLGALAWLRRRALRSRSMAGRG